jgi:hypothetical protein
MDNKLTTQSFEELAHDHDFVIHMSNDNLTRLFDNFQVAPFRLTQLTLILQRSNLNFNVHNSCAVESIDGNLQLIKDFLFCKDTSLHVNT